MSAYLPVSRSIILSVFAISSFVVDNKLQRQYVNVTIPLISRLGAVSLLTVVGAAPRRYAAAQSVRSELIKGAHAARPQHAAGRAPSCK